VPIPAEGDSHDNTFSTSIWYLFDRKTSGTNWSTSLQFEARRSLDKPGCVHCNAEALQKMDDLFLSILR